MGGGVTGDDLGGITGTSTPDTELLTVSYTGRDPVFAARAVNAVAQVFQSRVREAQQPGGAQPESDQSGSAGQSGLNTTYIIDPATVPGAPAGGRTALYTVTAAIVGLLGAFGLAVVREYLNDKVRDREDVEAAGLSLLGVVPRVREKSERLSILSAEHAQGFFAEGYHQLRTNVDFAAREQGIRSLLVTSTAPKDGKTTVASNLAILFAGAGRNVILVDGDLRRPAVHSFFGLTNRRGLSTVLASDDVDVRSLLQGTAVERLQVLTSGPLPAGPVEVLSSPRLSQVMTRLALLADLVIWDSAPVVALTDAALIGNYADAVLMVVAAGRTQTRALGNLGQGRQARVVGAVLNGVTRETGTGYDYYYKYTGRYGYVLRQPWVGLRRTRE